MKQEQIAEQNADGLIHPKPLEGMRFTSSEGEEFENAIMLRKWAATLLSCEYMCVCLCLYVHLTHSAGL